MADPDPFSVALLTLFDGAVGDTSYQPELTTPIPPAFEDSRQFDFVGDAQLSDAQPLFGATTVYLDGVGDALVVNDQFLSVAFHLGPADELAINLEWFVFVPSLAADRVLVSTEIGQAGIRITALTNGAVRCQVFNTGPTALFDQTSAPSLFTQGAWHYFKWIVNSDGSIAKLYVGELGDPNTTLALTGSMSGSFAFDHGPLTLGANAGGASGNTECYIGPVRWTLEALLDDNDMPTAPFPAPGTPDPTDPPPEPEEVRAFLPGPLGGDVSASILVSDGPALQANLPGPLGQVQASVQYDFTSLLSGEEQVAYELEITGDPVLRIPMTSWQATLQLDRSNYVQCVFPNADAFLSEISARLATEEFIIYRVTTVNGQRLRSEMARSGIDTVSVSRGPRASTATMYGYTDGFVEGQVVPRTVPLVNIRSVTIIAGGATRARAAIDWFLRPGQRVNADGSEFVAVYMNLYATSDGDEYMDVGDRS